MKPDLRRVVVPNVGHCTALEESRKRQRQFMNSSQTYNPLPDHPRRRSGSSADSRVSHRGRPCRVAGAERAGWAGRLSGEAGGNFSAPDLSSSGPGLQQTKASDRKAAAKGVVAYYSGNHDRAWPAAASSSRPIRRDRHAGDAARDQDRNTELRGRDVSRSPKGQCEAIAEDLAVRRKCGHRASL